jgi:hypothetical protein
MGVSFASRRWWEAKGSFQAPVVRDLVLQRLGGLLHDGDRGEHLRKMLLQHFTPFGGRGIPFAAQACEGLHLPDGHMRLAQAQQESDPFHIRGRITALATRRTRHGRNQTGALVVTQRVRAQACAFGDFGNGQERCHGNDSGS